MRDQLLLLFVLATAIPPLTSAQGGLVFLANWKIMYLDLVRNEYRSYNINDREGEHTFQVVPSATGIYALTSSKQDGRMVTRLQFVKEADLRSNRIRYETLPIESDGAHGLYIYKQALLVSIDGGKDVVGDYAIAIDATVIDSIRLPRPDYLARDYRYYLAMPATDSVQLDSIIDSYYGHTGTPKGQVSEDDSPYVDQLSHEAARILRHSCHIDTISVNLKGNCEVTADGRIDVQNLNAISNMQNGIIAFDVMLFRGDVRSSDKAGTERYFVVYNARKKEYRGYPYRDELHGWSMVMFAK